MWLQRHPELIAFQQAKDAENGRFFSGALDAATIESIQTNKLNSTIDYVRSRAPFYQARLGDVRGALTPRQLPSLPLTTRDDLKTHRRDLFAHAIEDCHLYCETTGTTGEAAPSLRHPLDRIWMNSNWVLGWGRIVGGGRSVVGLIGPSELHGMVDTFADVFQGLGRCVAKIYPFSTKVNFRKALQVMRDLRVGVLCVTPTIALMFVRAARVHGFDLERDFALEQIFLTGELCSEAMCRNVASFWRCQVMNNPFASQEALGMTVGGADGLIYGLPLSYIYELVDPVTGEPRDGRGRGELVVTMIEPGARPLIRFRTGDYVELGDAGTDLRAPTLTPLGRVRDILQIEPVGAVSAYDFEQALLGPLSRVLNYQIVVEGDAGGKRHIAEVELEEGRTLGAEERDRVADSFERRLGVRIELRQIERADGASSMGAIAGWKAARVKDQTTSPDAERAFAELAGGKRAV